MAVNDGGLLAPLLFESLVIGEDAHGGVAAEGQRADSTGHRWNYFKLPITCV